MQKGWTLHDCGKDHRALFAKCLEKLCSMKWKQIREGGAHGFGAEPIARGSIYGKVPQHVTDDVKSFLVFRLGGGKNATFGGLRRDEVFQVFWVDPDGKLYDHGHT